MFVARWLRGGATIDWLLTHPEWFDTADICQIAFDEAAETKAKEDAPPAS